jgi:hypothetical protein
MKYRDVELYYQQTLDNVGTKIMDLRTTDPISAIRFTFFGTNDATFNKENYLNDVITKIELVDGSDQLLSLSMKEAQALQFRRTGKMPFMRPGESASGAQEEQVMILFGRYLWDTEYFMDLTKFRNPQLKITTNIAAIRAAGDAGFLTGTLQVSVDLLVIQEGAEASKGFMMAKNIYGFTGADSGDEHIDMPMDYPYLGLLLRAYQEGHDPDHNISKIKLNCDAGKYIPFDIRVKDLYRCEENDVGIAELRQYIFRKDAEWVHHIITHDPIVVFNPGIPGRIAGAYTAFNGQFKFNLRAHDNTPVAAEENTAIIIRGSCPHSTVYIPFGIPENPATYFDPKVFGDIDLILTQDDPAAIALVLIQLRPYGAAA